MKRICNSLAGAGYAITLVGRRLPTSLPLASANYTQKRIRCFFNRGKWFYAEYNIRLFFFLLFKKMDAICAIDLDTILPCLRISQWKKIPRIYDAHEFFTELKEVLTRPAIQKRWLAIEKKSVPRFKWGYTVSESLANEFHQRYGVHYATIRNLPLLNNAIIFPPKKEKYILFQGAVNEARGFEYLVPALKDLPYKLVICGDGNFMPQLKKLIAENNVADKIELKGMLKPDELLPIALQATIGIGLAEKEGLNQWLALPNKFLDYIHAGLPQISMNYPEYASINAQHEVAVLIDNLETATIANAISSLMEDDAKRKHLHEQCLQARKILNWQAEEKKLLEFYKTIFAT